MKNKLKQIIALVIVLTFMLPALNFGIVNTFAATNYLTVVYNSSHADFETAYGANDREVIILTITGDGELTYEDCRFISEELAVKSINFTNAKFKDNKVPDGAFKEYFELISLALPMSVAEIGIDAFNNCVSLKNIGFTGNLHIIGDRAFYKCVQLESISLPGMLNKIGENAFAECGALETVIALRGDGSAYKSAGNAFDGVSPKCVLVTPEKSKGYDKAPFSHMKKVEWIFYTLPLNTGVAAGTDFSISVDVAGADGSKAKYQWYRDGYKIPDATGDTLVISNISPEYSGRYTVAITINSIEALISCIIVVDGPPVTGETKISSKNTAPEHNKPVAPDKIKYDYINVVDSNGKNIGEFKAETKEFFNSNKLDSLTYIIYTKKIKELYDKEKTGKFKFNFTNSGTDGRTEVPFDIINSIKNIDLTKDNQFRVTIKGSGQYSVYFAVTDESGKVLYDFKDARNLPGVYMYLPHDNKDYMIRIDEAMFAYPVPSVKDGNMFKFKIQNNFLYSRQTPAPSDFTDIKKHWGEKDIVSSAKNLIVNGYPDKSYKPDGFLTRAEFTAMLTRALYHNLISDTAKIKKYGDVKSSDWFSEAVGLGDMMGLTGFITGSDFKPNQEITREEMAYMIEKALVYAGIDTSKFISPSLYYFDLKDIDAKYQNSVKICTNSKLLQGAENNKFLPKKTLTRAEAATVLNRLLAMLANNI